MSSIHYKFSASSTYKTVVFNGITISLSGKFIVEKSNVKWGASQMAFILGGTFKNLGHSTDWDGTLMVYRVDIEIIQRHTLRHTYVYFRLPVGCPNRK